MEPIYEIPFDAAQRLSVGEWVEIFEAYGRQEGGEPIRVRSMRAGGRMIVLEGTERRDPEAKPLRPHEGEIRFLEHRGDRTAFGIRLRSAAA